MLPNLLLIHSCVWRFSGINGNIELWLIVDMGLCSSWRTDSTATSVIVAVTIGLLIQSQQKIGSSLRCDHLLVYIQLEVISIVQ